jgi:ABC-2 type transport system ATP-binding protein
MIEVKGLVKDYGSKRAVDNISFTVKRGDILGFLGPNGAGKSTTMKMITGFVSPSAGTAIVDGHDVTQDPVAVKKCLGYLPESAPAYGEMTVEEFLAFIAEVRGFRSRPERDEKVDRALALTHLESVRTQTIETLSDGLDPNQKNEVRALIKNLAAEKAVILSTHILEEVEAICTRVIIISQGKVVVDETPAQFRARQPGARLDEIFRTLTSSDA